MRVTVVGAGIVGLATAWALRRDGHDVVVYEQGTIPHSGGSSVDEHRLIRLPYGAHAGYTRMAIDAYAVWDVLWEALGRRLYEPTGTLVLDSEPDGAWATRSAEALASIGRPVAWLTPAEIEQRYPMLRTAGVGRGFVLDSGGVLFAEEIVGALAAWLRESGVALREQTRVADVDLARARLRLHDGRTVDGDALVVAAGAWVARLVPALAPRLTPSRQVVVYLRPPAPLGEAWTRAPMVLDIAPAAGFYLVPPARGTGLKVGDHRFSLAGDPDAPREPRAEETDAVLAACRERLRDFDTYTVDRARVCFYTVSEDERFVVERHGPSVVASACSGHGFKFGALVGRRIADAIAGRYDSLALSRWAAAES